MAAKVGKRDEVLSRITCISYTLFFLGMEYVCKCLSGEFMFKKNGETWISIYEWNETSWGEW